MSLVVLSLNVDLNRLKSATIGKIIIVIERTDHKINPIDIDIDVDTMTLR